MKLRGVAIAFVIGCVGLAGCDFGFDAPSLVLGPRLLTVVADPPEVRPGDDVAFEVITASPDDAPLTVEVSIDLSTRALAASAGQALGEPAAPIVLELVDGVFVLDGATTRAAIEALELALGEAAPGTIEGVVGYVYETVGLTIAAQIVVRDAEGRVVLEGFKRLTITSRSELTTNPPPPRFRVGDAWVRGDGSRVCAAEDAPPAVPAGTEIELAPEEEDWLERYPALDLEGQVVINDEAGYYSWFSTGGAFDFPVTRAPRREVRWTAPEAPGRYPLWLVVRDGHLGSSACRFDVDVR